MGDTSLSEANKLSKTGRLFENNAPKGSVISWRHRAGVGGTPTGRIAMSEVIPFTKADEYPREPNIEAEIEYCKCEDPKIDVRTNVCDICGLKYDFYNQK